MVNPTSLSRPKPIAFSITGGTGPLAFEVWNITQDEIIRTDNTSQTLVTSVSAKGAFDMSFFTTWEPNDKIRIMFSGYEYGSIAFTVTAATLGSQKISAVASNSGTALPALNMGG